MDHVTEPRSVALRNDQITEKDLALLVKKAKEMVEKGTTPPAPVNPVREGKRVRVKN
ncbi:MAG: hypothetical protein MUF18_13035 [Fimbriiglobus sp.]|nr:hypothetical protein [Fimbriiglobus sp.]